MLADPSILKIVHAGDNDLAQLKRCHDFVFASVFDTSIAWRFLGGRALGLDVSAWQGDWSQQVWNNIHNVEDRDFDAGQRIVGSERRGLWAWLLRGGLWILSLAYGLGVRVRNGLYRIGWKRTCRAAVQRQIEEMFLNAFPRAREFYRVRVEAGRVVAYSDEKGIFIGRKG